jgi:hypothetical protein
VAVAGARWPWGGRRRGRMGQVPVGTAAGVGRVCGLGEDCVGGQAREDGGRVGAVAGWRPGHGGWWARRSWRRGSESSERERGKGAQAFFWISQ